MRPTRTLALLSALLMLSGCHRRYVVPESPMPPDTILLSQMMRQLSAQPGFTTALLDKIDKSGKKGPALLTPKLLTELRKRIFGQDWQGLDRFPGWTMHEINPTVRVAGHVAGKDQALESASAVHPGSPISGSPISGSPISGSPISGSPISGSPISGSPVSGAPLSSAATREYLDLGPYALDKQQTISLDQPSTLPGFTTEGIVTDLGDVVVRGDGPNGLAPEHAESQRLADVLNRLAANSLNGAQPFMVTFNGHEAKTPEQLIDVLAATGHEVVVNDARYFANFGHLHYKHGESSAVAEDVMMPFWINSEIIVPHTGGLFHKGRPLLVPASHAELEWHIHPAAGAHGPSLNADISYYFGVDGKSEWRTMDTLDQAWVLKRNAHEYTRQQAVEVTRLASLLTVAYMHLHAAHPTLPFGGYYALGVCQDGVSAIEHKLTGNVTLFPNTADDAFFNDPRDAEVNAMIAAIPKDRNGAPPHPERIFGSLPVAPAANGSGPFDAITIPGLAADLDATYAAWRSGDLDRTHTRVFYIAIAAGIVLVLSALLATRRKHRLT
jgi:hypothetical protein